MRRWRRREREEKEKRRGRESGRNRGKEWLMDNGVRENMYERRMAKRKHGKGGKGEKGVK